MPLPRRAAFFTMRNLFLLHILVALSATNAHAQPGFCGEPYSTFFSANIFVPNALNPTLDGALLPFGCHIIAVFNDNGNLRCAGSIQWSGLGAAMVVNGADGTLPGYQTNELYKYIVQLADGCLIDSVAVTYDVSGIYTNTGKFLDGTYAKLASFHAVARPWLAVEATNGLCGENTAAIEASASSLGAPNRFQWNTGDTTAAITGLPNGTYTVTATSAYGCSVTGQGAVSNVPAMMVQLNTEYQSATVACQSVASVSGGTSPLSYAWSNGQTSNTATKLPSGNFTLTVTDANGCTAVQSDHCIISAVGDMPGLTQFSVVPNPASTRLLVHIQLANQEHLRIRLFNSIGQNLFETTRNTNEIEENIDLLGFPSGCYFLQISTQSGSKSEVISIVR